MTDINPTKLVKDFETAGINIGGCNDEGVVWDLDGTSEIQNRPDVAAIIAAHDPTPVSPNEAIRDALLTESDWTQLNDVPLTLEKKLEWSIYRQALRDIPQDYGWENPTWPTKPVN